MFTPGGWRIEVSQYHVVKFGQFVSNFPRKSKLKHILILGGVKFKKKIRKFENVKNVEKLKMSFWCK